MTDAEKMLRCEVMVSTKREDSSTYSGSGFILKVIDKNNQEHIFLITNYHVIKNARSGSLSFALKNSKGILIPDRKIYTFDNYKSLWIHHPNEEIDLCAMQIDFINDYFENGNTILYSSITSDNFISDELLGKLSLIEDILMIGYPKSMYDPHSNLPIVRKGVTATPLQYNFNNSNTFIIDAIGIHGSSGSPVFLSNPDKNGIILLGIISHCSTHSAHGQVTTPIKDFDKPIFTETLASNHLLLAIKCCELAKFIPTLLSHLSDSNKYPD